MIRTFSLIFGTLSVVILLLMLTVPTDRAFETWTANAQGITCEDRLEAEEKFNCRQGGLAISEKSRHIRDTGLFMTVEKVYQDEDGRDITIRALGVCDMFFEMDDNRLWAIIN